jgi:hypothetical protein
MRLLAITQPLKLEAHPLAGLRLPIPYNIARSNSRQRLFMQCGHRNINIMAQVQNTVGIM